MFCHAEVEGQAFYWSIMTADDSIKCRYVNSGMTGQVGSFQNPRLCLQAFLSFLSHPLPVLLLVPFVARSLTPVSRSLLLNRTETLSTQANKPAIFLSRVPVYCITPFCSVGRARFTAQPLSALSNTVKLRLTATSLLRPLFLAAWQKPPCIFL